jgi:hypothetical protein
MWKWDNLKKPDVLVPDLVIEGITRKFFDVCFYSLDKFLAKDFTFRFFPVKGD